MKRIDLYSATDVRLHNLDITRTRLMRAQAHLYSNHGWRPPIYLNKVGNPCVVMNLQPLEIYPVVFFCFIVTMGANVHKCVAVVCVALYCGAAVATESKDTGWFVTAGLNAYSKNNIHYDIADIISGHKSMRDDNCGYNLSVGYDWEWIATELAFNRVRVSDANAVAITGRVTMPIFPLENLPYVGMEYGMVGARYTDYEYSISVHDEAKTVGVLVGLRYKITESFFINTLWQYNTFKMHVDVYDVPGKFLVRRQNISLGVGWMF